MLQPHSVVPALRRLSVRGAPRSRSRKRPLSLPYCLWSWRFYSRCQDLTGRARWSRMVPRWRSRLQHRQPARLRQQLRLRHRQQQPARPLHRRNNPRRLSSFTPRIKLCRSGGIGRHVRLRGVWGNPWGFESPLRHSPHFESKNLVSLCLAIIAFCHKIAEMIICDKNVTKLSRFFFSRLFHPLSWRR